MTTDAKGLRNSVVEAMAQAIHEARSFHSKDMHGTCRLFAEAALDAALDILGEHIDESWPTAPASWLLAQTRLRDSGKGDS